jgi:glycosyltransferase involved in cell wall biosynthesis
MPLSVDATAELAVDLSVVIPLKNEAGNLEPLAREVERALSNSPYRWECLWIDDGSVDASLAELQRIAAYDSRHRIVVLERNAGQAAAMSVGFSHARGRLLATLDADGQSDPADLPRLAAHLDARQLDLVNGWRQRRRDSGIRRISSRIANAFRNRLTGESVRDVGCSVRVMRREAVDGIPLFHGMHRFLPTLIRMNGFTRRDELPVHHRPRMRGVSKYGVHNRLWVGIGDTLMIRWLARRAVAPTVRALDGHRDGVNAAEARVSLEV